MHPTGNEAVLVAGGAGYIGSHTAKLLKQAGLTPEPCSPEEFGAFVKSETQKWAGLVHAAGIEPE